MPIMMNGTTNCKNNYEAVFARCVIEPACSLHFAEIVERREQERRGGTRGGREGKMQEEIGFVAPHVCYGTSRRFFGPELRTLRGEGEGGAPASLVQTRCSFVPMNDETSRKSYL